MITYILNSPILTGFGDWRYSGPLSIEQSRRLLENGSRVRIITACEDISCHACIAWIRKSLWGQRIPEGRREYAECV